VGSWEGWTGPWGLSRFPQRRAIPRKRREAVPESTAERWNGFDRFNEALRNLDEEIQDVRERFEQRRERISSELRKRADQVRSEVRKSDLFRRADQLRKDVEHQIERGRAQIYESVGLATKEDVERLNRKLNQIARKLNEISKETVRV
jgi:uncharacterized protein YukE